MYVGRLLAVLAFVAYVLAAIAGPPSSAFAVSSSFPVRQATPDLTAVKSNNVAGLAVAGVAWTWTVDIANGGTAPATFTAGQVVFIDNLPNVGVAYGTPTVAPPTLGQAPTSVKSTRRETARSHSHGKSFVTGLLPAAA